MSIKGPSTDKKYFTDFKVTKERTSKKKVEVDRQATRSPSYHSRKSQEASTLDNKEAQIRATINISLEDQ